MKVEVLASTMNQTDHSIVRKMNIQTDAIIVNQCKVNRLETLELGGKVIRFLSFSERGVGLSRNNALMRASADICMIADDDLVYVDNYEEVVLEAFNNNPQADVILFGVTIHDSKGQRTRRLSSKRVGWHNFMKYGAVRVAFKRRVIQKKNIFFSLLFGGGSKYGSGEDTIFLLECLKKGVKIYSNPTKIADVYNYSSTWFRGYNEKFFKDKGALFAALSDKMYYLLILQFAIRRKKIYDGDISIRKAIAHMIEGAKQYKRMT